MCPRARSLFQIATLKELHTFHDPSADPDSTAGGVGRSDLFWAALLLVEQYVARALELADFVSVLQKGRVQFVGESHELGEERILASYLGAGV